MINYASSKLMQKIKMILADLADIRAGYPFRGALTPHIDGDVSVVQMKNVAQGQSIPWNELVRTYLTGKRNPDCLTKDDILFVAKGNRNFAVYVEKTTNSTVCSPHFFVIRLNGDAPIMSEFLAWQINQVPAQKYFQKSAEGSNVPSIRRHILENLSIVLPERVQQETVIKLAKSAQREKKLLNELISNREIQLSTLAKKLLG